MLATNQSPCRSPDPHLFRNRIVAIVALPGVLLVLAVLTPAGQRKDVIAVSSVFVLFFAAPLFSVAAVVVPLFVPRKLVDRRRIIRASCLSIAALLLVLDFWLIGIGAGLKASLWKEELIPAAVLLGFALSQVLLRSPTVQSRP